jgi:hypothetical protein
MPVDVVALADPYPIDLVREGALTDDDARAPTDDSAYDDYFVYIEKDWQVRLELHSTDFDAFLLLFTPSGDSVQCDDAPGGGTDSLIEHTAGVGGVYRIRANCFDATGRGRYSLRIRVTPP